MNKDTVIWTALGALLLVLIIGVSILADAQDAGAYERGHAALLELNCSQAVAEFDRVINAPRIIDLRSFAYLSKREKAQCELYQQATVQEASGAPGDAAATYFKLVNEFADSPLSELASQRASAIANGYRVEALAGDSFCSTLTWTGAGSTFLEMNAGTAFPRLVDICGRMYEGRGDHGAAVKTYNTYLQGHVSDNWSEPFSQALVRNMTKDVAARNPGQLSVPGYNGPGKGDAVVITFYNDSPEPARVVMTGATTRIIEMEACRGCQTYAAPGPAACPKQGTAITYEFPQGAYNVVVELGSGETAQPFLGYWPLGNGLYETCFTKLK